MGWTREHAEAMEREVDRLRRELAKWRDAHDRVAEQLAGCVSDYSEAVEALHRAHAALDKGHDHTAETWADRKRFSSR